MLVGIVNLGGGRVAGMIDGSSGWWVEGGAGGYRCAVVQGVPVSGGDHQPLCVAVLRVPAELGGGRGDDARAGRHGLPRNDPQTDATRCQMPVRSDRASLVSGQVAM